jgi:hypothetical protein
MPKKLHTLIDAMPRQAVYTLASREGPSSHKEEVVQSSIGKTKAELLELIRELFPLEAADKRKQSTEDNAIMLLQKTCHLLKRHKGRFSESKKKTIHQLLNLIKETISL